MTKGQRAMAVAMIFPGGSGKGANPKNLGLSGELIRQARTVLAHAPDLATNVLTGSAKSILNIPLASLSSTFPGPEPLSNMPPTSLAKSSKAPQKRPKKSLIHGSKLLARTC